MSDRPHISIEVLDKEIAGLYALRDQLDNSASDLAQSLAESVTLCVGLSGQVVVTGMGKSGHVARKIASTLASTGCKATFVHPAEASHGDLGMISSKDVILALSNSGETTELGDVLGFASRFAIPLIGMTSVAGSTLDDAADICLLIPKVSEACAVTNVPTTSTTQMMALGDALAVSILRAKGFTAKDFHTFYPGRKLGAAMKRVDTLMHHTEMPLCEDRSSIAEAVTEMTRGGFGCVGVVNSSGVLVGIVTDGDLRRHFSTALGQEEVSEIMTPDPLVITPDALAAEALHMFSQNKITALFIVDERSRPVGLLHVHDCLATGVI